MEMHTETENLFCNETLKIKFDKYNGERNADDLQWEAVQKRKELTFYHR